MSRINELVRQVEQALLLLPALGGRVTRSLEKGFSYETSPWAVLHQVSDSPAEQPAPVGFEYRLLVLELELGAEGDTPHDAVEAALPDVHTTIRQTCGNGCKTGTVQWGYDDENPALGIVRVQYQILYRRPEGQL